MPWKWPFSPSGRDTNRLTIFREKNGKFEPDNDMCFPGKIYGVTKTAQENLKIPRNVHVGCPTVEEVSTFRYGTPEGCLSGALLSEPMEFCPVNAKCAIEIVDPRDPYQKGGRLLYQPIPLDQRTLDLPHTGPRDVFYIHLNDDELPTYYFRLESGQMLPPNVPSFTGVARSVERASNERVDSQDPIWIRSNEPSPEPRGSTPHLRQLVDDVSDDSSDVTTDGLIHGDIWETEGESNETAEKIAETTADVSEQAGRPPVPPITTDAKEQAEWIPFDVKWFESTYAPLMFLDCYTTKSDGWPMIRSKATIPEKYITRMPFKSPCLAHAYDTEEAKATKEATKEANEDSDVEIIVEGASSDSDGDDAHVTSEHTRDQENAVLEDNEAQDNTDNGSIDWDNDPAYQHFIGKLNQQVHLRYHRIHPISRFIDDEKDCQDCNRSRLPEGISMPEKEAPDTRKWDLLENRRRLALHRLAQEENWDRRPCSICGERLQSHLGQQTIAAHWDLHHNNYLQKILRDRAIQKKQAEDAGEAVPTSFPATNFMLEYELETHGIEVDDETSSEKLAYSEKLCNLAENEVLEREEYCRLCYKSFTYGHFEVDHHYQEHLKEEEHQAGVENLGAEFVVINAGFSEIADFMKDINHDGIAKPAQTRKLLDKIEEVRQSSLSPTSPEEAGSVIINADLDPSTEQLYEALMAQIRAGQLIGPSPLHSPLKDIMDPNRAHQAKVPVEPQQFMNDLANLANYGSLDDWNDFVESQRMMLAYYAQLPETKLSSITGPLIEYALSPQNSPQFGTASSSKKFSSERTPSARRKLSRKNPKKIKLASGLSSKRYWPSPPTPFVFSTSPRAAKRSKPASTATENVETRLPYPESGPSDEEIEEIHVAKSAKASKGKKRKIDDGEYDDDTEAPLVYSSEPSPVLVKAKKRKVGDSTYLPDNYEEASSSVKPKTKTSGTVNGKAGAKRNGKTSQSSRAAKQK